MYELPIALPSMFDKKSNFHRTDDYKSERLSSDRATLEQYQAFMIGYVRRLNEATFNVTIGGVRIGTAKHSRLAQINLRSRVITFSRYAVENVPERGRRYLVLHELAHVKEASHNKCFWSHVERFEPNYRDVGKSLELAFHHNVRANEKRAGLTGKTLQPGAVPRLLLAGNLRLLNSPLQPSVKIDDQVEQTSQTDSESGEYMFGCTEDFFSMSDEYAPGTMHGGSSCFTE